MENVLGIMACSFQIGLFIYYLKFNMSQLIDIIMNVYSNLQIKLD